MLWGFWGFCEETLVWVLFSERERRFGPSSFSGSDDLPGSMERLASFPKATMKNAEKALFPVLVSLVAYLVAWYFVAPGGPVARPEAVGPEAVQEAVSPGVGLEPLVPRVLPKAVNQRSAQASKDRSAQASKDVVRSKLDAKKQEQAISGRGPLRLEEDRRYPISTAKGNAAEGDFPGSSANIGKKSLPAEKDPASSAPGNADLAELDLPEICTADLPGLEFEDHKQALLQIRDAILADSAPHRSPIQNASDSPASQERSSFGLSGTSQKGFTGIPPGNDNDIDRELTRELVSIAARNRNFQQLPEAESPLGDAGINPHRNASSRQNAAYLKAASNPDVDPHAEAFSRSAFPSASECKSCHEQIYREWSMSGHAYAAISPMFHRFEQKINDLTQGTIGYFCLRCHAPVATTMELRRDQPIWDGPTVFREGVTCVACHRVVQAHGKDHGERRIEPGPVEAPIVASADGLGVELAKKHADYFKVKTDPNDKRPGQLMHRRVIQFDQLSKSTFCVSCHQIAVEPGIWLEVVWNQYRASPAWRKGITCQDCHMGRVPGMAEGYSVGPAALIDGKQVTADRKHSNHQFYGPGYSIAHPGIFPINPDAERWTVNQWLQFDWRSGWGSEAFEEALREGRARAEFPDVWSEADDRMDAREILDTNLKLLGYKRELRRQVMENGASIEGPFFTASVQAGKPLKFFYNVKNISEGHNMPSGSLGAQPQLWLNVALIGPRGNHLWESGYLDSVGDLADLHSADVLARRLPLDTQLFNLQTKFLTTNLKGTDREMYLPIPFDVDQIPFIRPDTRPNTVMNHPATIRMEAHSIAATGSRRAKYRIPAHLMTEPGCYRLTVRLRSRAEPIYFMKSVDATQEMIRAMNEGILDLHAFSKTFIVEPE